MTIEKDYEYFEKKRASIVKDHKGEFVLIKYEKIHGFFKTPAEAMQKAHDLGFELGSFIVQECLDSDMNVQRFHSRVEFA